LRDLTDADSAGLRAAYDKAYKDLFGRDIPTMEVEILTWALSISTVHPTPAVLKDVAVAVEATASGQRQLFDADRTDFVTAQVYQRDDLTPGMTLQGPALIMEPQTTTVVTGHFWAKVMAAGHIEIRRKTGDGS